MQGPMSGWPSMTRGKTIKDPNTAIPKHTQCFRAKSIGIYSPSYRRLTKLPRTNATTVSRTLRFRIIQAEVDQGGDKRQRRCAELDYYPCAPRQENAGDSGNRDQKIQNVEGRKHLTQHRAHGIDAPQCFQPIQNSG